MTDTKPTQGQRIVQEMFEGDKDKMLNEQQQAEQMRNLGKQRDSLRQAGDRHAKETDSGRGERSQEGQNRAQQQQGRRLSNQEQRQAEFDNFLQRTSNTQKQKDAGRELTRNLRHNPQTAQAWSVANSRHTSAQARRAILARFSEAQAQNQPQVAPRSGSQFLSQRTPSTTRSTPSPTEGLAIQYGLATPRGTPSNVRPFTGRYLTSQQISRHFTQWLMTQQGRQPNSQGQPRVMVQPRGSFLFVRDGQKFRAFRMNRDGSLIELPSEDASEQPLSNEARDHLRRVIRQRSARHSAQRRSPGEKGIRPDLDQVLKGKSEAAEGETGEADLETRFALMLHEVLHERKKLGRQLGEGEDPAFPEKSDWAAFFARLLGLGNQETPDKKGLDNILSLLFRGIFNKKGAGKYLVGDLKYLKDGKGREEKFAQVAVDQEGLLQLLAELRPGQKISLEALKKFFGEELNFLKMAHQNKKATLLAEGAEKNVVFNPKANIDPYSQARLERSLFPAKRPAKPTEDREGSHTPTPSETPQGVFANVFELMGLRRRLEGRSKFYTILTFLIFGSALGLVIALLLMQLL